MAENRSFKFRSRPEAVSAARRALDGFDSLLDAGVFYDASLCVSELVTNAVLHSRIASDAELRLDVDIDDGGAMRVTVIDSGRGFEPQQPDRGDDSGWGLFIVDRLASRWGVERAPDGTRVWFEIGARKSSGEPAWEGREATAADDQHVPQQDEREHRRGPMGRLRLGTEA
jgi:anti-sigma regulatory factor (Ser/Thr protein kinase)